MIRRAINQYQTVSVKSGVEGASPHQLIQMLMAGALDKVSLAKGHMERKNIAAKGEHISWAMSIIGGLQASLDLDKGGELAGNLDALYEYMIRRLSEANIHNDTAILDEVSSLMREVKSGWDAIAPLPQVATSPGKSQLSPTA
ncbi:MAG: flagellar export chaperone FliS [Gammaproteobacteria bacterium]|nr:flagellar export chaperone FliS [Gammaproteobacteria bacterium]